jgi:hypothetical protein
MLFVLVSLLQVGFAGVLPELQILLIRESWLLDENDVLYLFFV